MSQAPGPQAPAIPAADAAPRGGAWPWLLAALALALFAGLFLLGWLPRSSSRAALAAEAAEAARRPPRVRLALPVPAKASTPLQLPGTIMAAQETVLYARSSGYVRRWLADLGDRVEAGQLLAEIAAPELDQQLIQAQAVLAQAQAGITQAKAALALATLSLERFKNLGPEVATQQNIDTRQADHDTAAANLQLAEAKAQADAAELRRLQELVTFGRITAPFAGVITSRQVEIGALITGGSGSSAQPLYRIAQTDPLRVVVEVPQAAAGAIAVGLEAKVTPRGSDNAVAGTVARLAHALDSASRTMRVEVRIPNPDGRILPGMYAQVAFALPNPRPLLMVNAAALMLSGDGAQVAVVDAQQRVHLKHVTIDLDTGAELGISAGLERGDRVVVNPAGSLAEGILVEVAEPAPAGHAP